MANDIVQMRAKGSITIPAEYRKKYALEDGDVFSLVDLGEGSFAIVPRLSLVPKLLAELDAIREETGVTVEELLADIPKHRQEIYEERYRGRF